MHLPFGLSRVQLRKKAAVEGSDEETGETRSRGDRRKPEIEKREAQNGGKDLRHACREDGQEPDTP